MHMTRLNPKPHGGPILRDTLSISAITHSQLVEKSSRVVLGLAPPLRLTASTWIEECQISLP